MFISMSGSSANDSWILSDFSLLNGGYIYILKDQEKSSSEGISRKIIKSPISGFIFRIRTLLIIYKCEAGSVKKQNIKLWI